VISDGGKTPFSFCFNYNFSSIFCSVTAFIFGASGAATAVLSSAYCTLRKGDGGLSDS